MGDVFSFGEYRKKMIYRLDRCAGCGDENVLEEDHYRITLEHEDHKEQIALCNECNRSAEEHGVHFVDS